MPKIVSTVIDVYVFRRNGDRVDFLTLLRAPQTALGGTWQSVHGKIEPGETAWQAALRELGEETGLSPTGFWQIDFVNTFYVARSDQILMCPCFAAEVRADAAVGLSDEHVDFTWLPTDAACERFLWPGQREAVREIESEILGAGLAEPHLRIALAGQNGRAKR